APRTARWRSGPGSCRSRRRWRVAAAPRPGPRASGPGPASSSPPRAPPRPARRRSGAARPARGWSRGWGRRRCSCARGVVAGDGRRRPGTNVASRRERRRGPSGHVDQPRIAPTVTTNPTDAEDQTDAVAADTDGTTTDATTDATTDDEATV